MRNTAHRFVSILVLGVIGGMGFSGEAPKEILPITPERPETDSKIKELIRAAVDLFIQYRAAPDTKEGEQALKQAREKLDEALKLDPTDRVAHDIREEVGDAMFTKMVAQKELGRAPSLLDSLNRQFIRRGKIDDAELRKRIGEWVNEAVYPRTPDMVRWRLWRQLEEYDQFVIPLLVKHMSSEVQDKEKQGHAQTVAVRMGRPAVLPVIELLNHPDLTVRQNAAVILGHIKPFDARAVAALKRVVEDSTAEQTLRNYAARSLQWITGRPVEELKEAKYYYLQKADRYFQNTSGVVSETEEQEGVIWHLDSQGNMKPVYFASPVGEWVWNEIMAEEALRHALLIDPNYEPALALLAANTAAIIAEQRDMQDVKMDASAGDRMTAQQKAFIDEQEKKMFQYGLVLAGLGPRNLYRAIDKCLQPERRPQAAVVLMQFLVNLDRGRLNSAGNMLPPTGEGEAKTGAVWEGAPLIRALDDPDERVRIQAAITLALMNPNKKFAGADKVTSILADGIGKAGPYNILVVSDAMEEKNRYTRMLEDLGYVVQHADDGRLGIQVAAAFPPKNLILVSDRLKKELTTQEFLVRLADLPTTRNIPTMVLANNADIPAVKAELGTVLPDGFLPREDQGGALQKQIEGLVASLRSTRDAVNRFHRDEVAAASAAALAAIEPLHTFIPYAEEKCDLALRTALANRPDKVRLPVIQATGTWSRESIVEPLLKLFASGADANSVEIRRAAMKALAEINPLNPDVRLAAHEAVAKETDAEIRKWAAEASGRYDREPGGPTADQATKHFLRHRTDKDKLEN